MKILIVDDDPGVRKYLEEVMELMGHSVVSFQNGYDAIDHLREHEASLAYIDVTLPGIDGFQTLKKLREIDPKLSGVIISGDKVDELADPPVKDGVYISLKKPFDVEQIEEINKAYENIRGPLEFIYENPYGLDTEKLAQAKILVADDEKEILNVILTVLEDEQFCCLDTALDGDEATLKFDKDQHDLIITDIMMPKKNGIDLLRHVKAVSPNSQVIIITANADKDSAITAVKLGAYDYIEKPLDLYVLSRIVKRAIEKKLLLDEN
jgi:DNA-binding NtrC family response regulator